VTGILKAKTVIITGGSSGIGRGIALAAARHGAKVVIIGDLTDKPREGGETTASLLAADTQVVFRRTNVTTVADVDALVDEAEIFGGVDLMVCNAGIALPDDGPDISPEDLGKLMSVNLAGVLASAQSAARQMNRLRKPGSIVLISSMGGIRGAGFTTGYSTTKGGVNMMAAALADAHGPAGIRVNAICPGLIDTALVQSSPTVAAAFEPMRQRMPLRRLGRPDEIGDVVAWLGSDLSSFVTGVALPVDGGQTAVI
jgi:NAD(P)-dependent dehydrogenase (short-subunit alcohol dehydrogenase family)